MTVNITTWKINFTDRLRARKNIRTSSKRNAISKIRKTRNIRRVRNRDKIEPYHLDISHRVWPLLTDFLINWPNLLHRISSTRWQMWQFRVGIPLVIILRCIKINFIDEVNHRDQREEKFENIHWRIPEISEIIWRRTNERGNDHLTLSVPSHFTANSNR